MAPSQSVLSLLQSVVSRPQMENGMSSETGLQSAEDGVRPLCSDLGPVFQILTLPGSA